MKYSLKKEDETMPTKHVVQESPSPVIEQGTEIKKEIVGEVRPWVR